MTESQKRCALVGYRRRLEVVYNQLFADCDLSLRQDWIRFDQILVAEMIEQGIHESKATRVALEYRMDAAREQML